MNKYEKYGADLVKAARFGKSRMLFIQMLNRLSYSNCPEKFRPVKFTLQKVKIYDN